METFVSPSKRKSIHSHNHPSNPNKYGKSTAKADSTTMEHSGGDDNNQTAAFTSNQGIGGVNRGMSAANAISNQDYAWSLPNDMISKHAFTIDIEHITTPLNITLKNDQLLIVPTTLLTHYANPNSKNYAILKATQSDHMYKMLQSEVTVLLTAGTREQILIQAATQFKSRDFLNAPMMCGQNVSKTFYKMNGIVQANGNIRVPSLNIAEISNYMTCVTNDEHEYDYEALNVENGHTISYKQNLPEWFTVPDWDALSTALVRGGEDPNFTYTPQRIMLPIWQQETIGTNLLEFTTEPGTSDTNATPNLQQVYLPQHGQHLKEFALTAPAIVGEDGNFVTFNYTVRFKHNLKLLCVPKDPIRPQNARIYNSKLNGLLLPIVQGDNTSRANNTTPKFGWETVGLGYYRMAPISLNNSCAPTVSVTLPAKRNGDITQPKPKKPRAPRKPKEKEAELIDKNEYEIIDR